MKTRSAPIKTLLLTLLTTLLVGHPNVQAQDRWRVSGYGSLAAGKITEGDLTYSNYDSDRWHFDGDTVLGIQINGQLAERLSLTLQAVSRAYNFDDQNQYEPELDWLFLAYQVNANWRLRLGRLRTPHYLYSETIDVGYSYVWVRPPMDVYASVLAPFSNFDGVDLTWLIDWQDTSIDFQLLAGLMERSRETLKIEVDPMLGGNIKVQNGPYTLRYSLIYDQTDIRIESNRPTDPRYYQILANNPDLVRVLRSLRADDAWYRYQSLGLRWEDHNWGVVAEAFDIRNTDDGYTNDAQGWYLSVQHRFGKFTPYLVRGSFKNTLNEEELNLLADSFRYLPEGRAGFETLDQVRSDIWTYYFLNNTRQTTWTAGVRYDVVSNLALKGEWQYFQFPSDTSGQLVQAGLAPPENTSLVTLTLDWMF